MESDEELGRTKYTNLGPDDIFHAIVYAIVSIDMMQGNTLLNIKLDNIN
jgi:hypothetical protein